MPQTVTCNGGGGLGVAIAVRNRLFRESLVAQIEHDPELRVLGATESCAELPQLCALRSPQLVVFEMSADQEDLVRTIAELRARYRRLYLVGIYDRPDSRLAERLLRVGANRLVAASGGTGALLKVLRQPGWEPSAATQRQSPLLTDRELRVLHLIGSGYSREQVSAALEITPRTVENYKRRIFGKLHAHSQAHAVASGMRLGLLPRSAEQVRRPAPQPAPGHPAVALLCGGGRPAARVARILVANRIPLIVDRAWGALAAEHPARHVRGPLITVLVDPEPAQWPVPPGLSSRAIVVVSAEPAQAAMVHAVLNGADAMLGAARLAQTLVPAFRMVEAGYQVLDADQARRFIAAAYIRLGMRPSAPVELTRRENQILSSITAGHSVKQTARTLGISVKTVESLQSGLFRKLGARTRAEALVVAHGLGLVGQED
jgi:DNA-binding NarL/FixJ family response regulator